MSVGVIRVNSNLITFILGAQVECQADCNWLIEENKALGPIRRQITGIFPQKPNSHTGARGISISNESGSHAIVWWPFNRLKHMNTAWQVNMMNKPKKLVPHGAVNWIGAFGHALPAILWYDSQRAGWRYGKTFSAQLIQPWRFWNLWRVFWAPCTVKAVLALINLVCFTVDIVTDIGFGSTWKPIMGIDVPQICFSLSCGRLISSHSWRRGTWSEGRKASYLL